MKKRRKWFQWWMVPLLICITGFVLFRYVLLIGYVPTVSMEPTLKKGSYLLASRVYSGLETGDVIVFWHDGKLLVKRIAAVGGENINLKGLVYHSGWAVPKREADLITVPEESFFVLGDNVENSVDSRYWEDMYVEESDVVGKVISIS